jgi:hypothetical protein
MRWSLRKRNRRMGYRASIGMVVRSSWEHNYVLYLNLLIAQGVVTSWQYECTTFELSIEGRVGRFYTPDFRVVFPDGSVEYHEVKGYMDDRSKAKIEHMAVDHPDVRLVVVGKDAYRAIAEGYRSVLPDWEG